MMRMVEIIRNIYGKTPHDRITTVDNRIRCKTWPSGRDREESIGINTTKRDIKYIHWTKNSRHATKAIERMLDINNSVSMALLATTYCLIQFLPFDGDLCRTNFYGYMVDRFLITVLINLLNVLL